MPPAKSRPRIWHSRLRILDQRKKFKVEPTVAYSPEINGIAECTNGFVVSKAKYLLLNAPSKIGQLFWPETFTTIIYLLNCSFLSFFKYDCPLAVWLRAYNSINKSYAPNLYYFQTFACQVNVKIPYEKRVKSQEPPLLAIENDIS